MCISADFIFCVHVDCEEFVVNRLFIPPGNTSARFWKPSRQRRCLHVSADMSTSVTFFTAKRLYVKNVNKFKLHH